MVEPKDSYWLGRRSLAIRAGLNSNSRVALLMGCTYGILALGLFAGVGAAFAFSSSVAAVATITGAVLGFGLAFRLARHRSRAY